MHVLVLFCLFFSFLVASHKAVKTRQRKLFALQKVQKVVAI